MCAWLRWRRFRSVFRLGLAAPWAAARPRAVRAACCCLLRRWCSGRRRARPPARLGVLTAFGAAPRSPARPRCRPSISHVIPLRLVQTLYLHRWNCNVFGVSRKMTAINYVRDLSGPGLPPSGAVAWPAGDTTPIRPARPLACLQSLSKRLHRGCPKMSHVIPLRLVQILNSCRWDCNVFGWSRKMTEGNYVRNLSGPGLPPSGAVAWPAGDVTPIRPATQSVDKGKVPSGQGRDKP